MAGDPTDVGRTPEDVTRAVVEDGCERVRGPDEVAPRGMEDAFGFASGAGGVQDEERVFCAHRFSGAVFARTGHQCRIRNIAIRVHRDLAARAAHNDHPLDHRPSGSELQCGVDIGLEWDGFPASQAFIRRNNEFGAAILDPTGQ